MADPTSSKPQTSSLDSTFPVLVPHDPTLFLTSEKFDAKIKELLQLSKNEVSLEDMEIDSDDEQTAVGENDSIEEAKPEASSSGHPFMDALHSAKLTPVTDADLRAVNKMRTTNNAITYRSTESALLDLFTELEKTVTDERLDQLLGDAWETSPTDALKIIWNARSIHLGKGEKQAFYKCLGWLVENGHLLTVVKNLSWLSSAVIEKKVNKSKDKSAQDTDDDTVMITDGGEEDETGKWDVKNGVAHGYWKDILNILALEANDQLAVYGKVREVLNPGADERVRQIEIKAAHRRKRAVLKNRAASNKVQKGEKNAARLEKEKRQAVTAYEQRLRDILAGKAKRHELENQRHASFMLKYQNSNLYRALHLTVARLFAQQLKDDLVLLKSGKKNSINRISLCAKWAPSLEGFHDKSTFIASSIAEILYPLSSFSTPGLDQDRTLYLKHARESYRRLTLSPLRKALSIVEHHVTAQTFSKIAYEKVPSLAMDNYKDLFAQKDFDHFSSYIEQVAQGQSRISGAVLTPGGLVKQAREAGDPDRLLALQLQAEENRLAGRPAQPAGKKIDVKKMVKDKMAALSAQVLDGQWNTLVQRIRDSGTLADSIAVCDVSGSMGYPTFADGSTPMDSAVGLSLLISAVTKPPFGGSFITFHSNPKVVQTDPTASFSSQVHKTLSAPWGMSTDFNAVFEKLILPLALEHKLKPEDMVKQVFVFSDMQFNEAESSSHHYSSTDTLGQSERWSTNHERIKGLFARHGYELPRMIYWNLAGGAGSTSDDKVAPKPVKADTEGAALVSGYSQAMVKVFLEDGMFKDEEEVVEEEVKDEESGEITVVTKTVKKEKDPLEVVKKAIGHKAFEMLAVYD